MTQSTDSLSILLFGDMKLRKGIQYLPGFPTVKSKALFARLVLNAGRIFSRENLAEIFWQDLAIEKARKCLRTELWRVRQVLGFGGKDLVGYLQVNRQGICFDSSAEYILDVSEFESRMAKVRQHKIEQLTEQDCIDLKECLVLYRGDLLETVDDNWHLLRREQLRSQYLMALELLVHYHMSLNDWNSAIAYANQLLTYDNLLEHIHLYLMKCYSAKGNRTAAINQYQQCRQLLVEELGVSPMHETEKAYREIIAYRSGAFGQSLSPSCDSSYEQATVAQSIQRALRNLESTEKLLVQAAERLGK